MEDEQKNSGSFKLSMAANTLIPCLLAIKQLGFIVTKESTNEREIWRAESSSKKLLASDLCQLLGIIKLVEMYGEEWQASDYEIQDFLKTYYSNIT